MLAARLSEDFSRNVLLIEAGPDYPDASQLPDDVLDAAQPTVEHDWGYFADEHLDRGMAVPRARLMGGCSATNACFAQRGARQGYDNWAALGIRGWSFAEVIGDFCRLESDQDFAGEWHGGAGPLPIRRHPRNELNAAQTAFLDAAVLLGHNYVDDHNRPDVVGVGPSPRTALGGVRMSTAMTYLAQARSRDNLEIWSNSLIDHVIFKGKRTTGIRLADNREVEADRVILASGAYRFGVHATMRSSAAGRGEPPDLMLFTAGPFDADTSQIPSGAAFGIVVGLMAPRSRGWVHLMSRDPNHSPRIHFGHLSDPNDTQAMLDGIIEARRIAKTQPMADVVTGDELSPGIDVRSEDIRALERWARANVTTFHHPVGTCSMGPPSNSHAVTDELGAVYGVTGLFVADASIIPVVPTGTPNLPTIMVAERIARAFKKGRTSVSGR